MADFIFKPSANAAGVFTDSLEFQNFNPGQTVPVEDGTYDIYQRVVSSFPVISASSQFSLLDVGMEPVITATDGAISVTIGTGIHAGTYTHNVDGQQLTVSMLAAGPTCYKRPGISGITEVGESLTITPGLWLYAGADPGDQTFQQRLNGVDITGGTGLSYDVQLADEGAVFTVEERFGGVAVDSDPLSLSFSRQMVVFPIIGQSNACDIEDFDNGSDYPAGRVFQWGRHGGNDGVIIPAARPMDHPSQIRTMPIWLQFSIDYLAANPETNLLFVPCALDGSGLRAGEWQQGEPVYNDMVNRTNAVLAQNPSFSLGGFLVHIGETNASIDPVAFEGLFDTFIGDVRADVLAAGPATPFVAGGLVPDFLTGNPDVQTVHNTILDTPNRVAYTGVADSAGATSRTTSSDPVHFNAAGLRTMGARYVPALAAAASNAPGVPDQVTGLSVTVGAGELTLAWSAPDMNLSPFVHYAIERSVSGGAFSQIATSSTIGYTDTGLTEGTLYTYRVFATNSLGDGPVSDEASGTPTGASSFAPTDLTGLYSWYDFTDPAAVFTDPARTAAVSANGDQVRGVLDKSANGYHINSPANSNTWDATNTQVTLSGATDCFFVADALTSISDTQVDMEVFFAIRTTDTTFILIGSEDGGRFTMYGNDGSGDTGYSGNMAGSTFYADGVQTAGDNQDALHAEWSTGAGLVASADTVPLLSIAQTNGRLKLFGWIADGFQFDGAVSHVVITRALSASDRIDLLNWLSARTPS